METLFILGSSALLMRYKALQFLLLLFVTPIIIWMFTSGSLLWVIKLLGTFLLAVISIPWYLLLAALGF